MKTCEIQGIALNILMYGDFGKRYCKKNKIDILPVTPEAAGSSPVTPATFKHKTSYRF